MADQPGYTRVPNAILDAMPTMPDAERRVILAIVRKTAGWQKRRDKLSITQLEQLTGLSRPAVVEATKDAQAHTWIERVPDGNSFAYQLTDELWVQTRIGDDELVNQQGQEPELTSKHSLPEAVNSVNHLLVNSVNTQKKDLKERKERESEGAKAPRPTRTEKQKPLNFAHEAVQVFRQLTGVRNVAPAMADRIAETVVDFPAWREAVSNWLAAGFKPNNIGGMLDWYLHPDRQKREQKNTPKPPPKTEYYQSQAHKYPPEEERRRLLVEGLAKRTAIRNVGDS